jgi:branched-chain amino acid transport system substrate-binding protein
MVVKIGHVAPADRPHRPPRQGQRKRRRLAIDDANALKIEIGGQVVKFELLGEDDQADPKPAPSSPRSWLTPRSPASSVT